MSHTYPVKVREKRAVINHPAHFINVTDLPGLRARDRPGPLESWYAALFFRYHTDRELLNIKYWIFELVTIPMNSIDCGGELLKLCI